MAHNSKFSFARSVGEWFAVFGAASASAAAVRAHRQPNPRDLDVLGIDAAAFKAIGK